MTPEARIDEIIARIQLAQGSATLLVAIADSDAGVDETRRILIEILRATPMDVDDLGVAGAGPARWAEQTRKSSAQAFVLMFSPPTPESAALATTAFARLVNPERELLRQLAAPVVLVLSRGAERALRAHAPDFFTWVAQTYELPGPHELRAVATKRGVEEEEEAAPAEEPVRFLHISDIHLRPQRVKRYDQDRVLRGLLAFLERDRASFPLDLIFVTGDLAQSGKADEYALVVDLLKRVLEITSVPPERMFVVPGNHDVDRDVGRWLLRTLSRDEEAITFFEDPRSRAFHEQKFAEYKKSMGSLFGATRPLGIGVGGDAVEVVEVKGARLAVASFNSAWFAQGDDDKLKLWIGDPNVQRAIDRVADEEALFAIALMHHPFEDLHPVDRTDVERQVERGFDLLLRGHLHNPQAHSLAGQRGGFIQVAAPASYQGSQWGNGCFLGEIRPRARTVRLRPYMYASGPDPWVLDTKVFPDDAEDGHCRTYSVPAKRRTKSAFAEPLRRAAEVALEALPSAERREILQQAAPEAEGVSDRDLGKQAAAAARLLADTPELQGVLGKKGGDLVLTTTLLAEVASKKSGAKPRDISDATALEEVLMETGRLFLKVTSSLGLRQRLSGDSASIAIAAVLGALTERASAFRRLPMNGITNFRPDILIARSDRSGGLTVVEVKDFISALGLGLAQSTERGLAQLDRYLAIPGVDQGALVLLDALPPDATEPRIEHARTLAGRAVLVLHL